MGLHASVATRAPHRIPATPELSESFILELYEENKKLIHYMAFRYNAFALDRAFEKDDFTQIGYLAVIDCAANWDFSRGRAHFRSLLFRYLQKLFRKKVTGKNKLVEIRDRYDRLIETLPWTVYLKRRREIQASGYEAHTVSRIVPLFEGEEHADPTDGEFAEYDIPEHLMTADRSCV